MRSSLSEDVRRGYQHPVRYLVWYRDSEIGQVYGLWEQWWLIITSEERDKDLKKSRFRACSSIYMIFLARG